MVAFVLLIRELLAGHIVVCLRMCKKVDMNYLQQFETSKIDKSSRERVKECKKDSDHIKYIVSIVFDAWENLFHFYRPLWYTFCVTNVTVRVWQRNSAPAHLKTIFSRHSILIVTSYLYDLKITMLFIYLLSENIVCLVIHNTDSLVYISCYYTFFFVKHWSLRQLSARIKVDIKFPDIQCYC